VLARDPGDAVVARSEHVGQHTARFRLIGRVERVQHRVEVVAERAQHVGDRGGVRTEDLHPEGRVAGRDARGVAQSLTGEPEGGARSVAQTRGEQRRDELRRV
jgi:hypothetical protein